MLSVISQLCSAQKQATEPGAKVAELMPSKIVLPWETASAQQPGQLIFLQRKGDTSETAVLFSLSAISAQHYSGIATLTGSSPIHLSYEI